MVNGLLHFFVLFFPEFTCRYLLFGLAAASFLLRFSSQTGQKVKYKGSWQNSSGQIGTSENKDGMKIKKSDFSNILDHFILVF